MTMTEMIKVVIVEVVRTTTNHHSSTIPQNLEELTLWELIEYLVYLCKVR